MNASIDAIKTHYNETTIKISAQSYLKRFYNNLGFSEIGDEYLRRWYSSYCDAIHTLTNE